MRRGKIIKGFLLYRILKRLPFFPFIPIFRRAVLPIWLFRHRLPRALRRVKRPRAKVAATPAGLTPVELEQTTMTKAETFPGRAAARGPRTTRQEPDTLPAGKRARGGDDSRHRIPNQAPHNEHGHRRALRRLRARGQRDGPSLAQVQPEEPRPHQDRRVPAPPRDEPQRDAEATVDTATGNPN